MGRFEAPIPNSCGECLLFDVCKTRQGNNVYATKTGLLNTQLRGSAECVTQFDADGGVLELPADTNQAITTEPIQLHRVPPGLLGARLRR